MRAQVRGRKTKLAPELFTTNHSPKDCIFASEHLRGLHEIARFDRLPNRRAADHFAVHLHRFHADNVEAASFAELLQQR